MAGAFQSLRWFVVVSAAAVTPLLAQSRDQTAAVTWNFTRLDEIGGHKTTLVGSPRVIDTPEDKAVEFDGKSDGIFLEVSPLAGLKQFTAEVIFRPYSGGAKEQRFLHFQEEGSENRLLFEIRIVDDRWFLDTFIKSGGGNHTLYAEKSTHEIGPWYHAAVVVDGMAMRHYVNSGEKVNGKEELSTAINYEPQRNGRTSIGVRINKVSWFKGTVRQIRVTPAVLSPQDFLRP